MLVRKLAKKQDIISWEKGETATSQSEVYSRLPISCVVIFYQSGNIEKGEFKIEIACNVVKTDYYFENHDKIMNEAKVKAKGRKIVKLDK
jgi:hypothetical protein